MTMETIYDHNVTEAELAVLFPSVITKAEHLHNGGDQDTQFGYIHNLYSIRGDQEKAKTYLEKIVDARYRFTVGSCDTPH
jgi:hypothetical protein